jgi:hypothetical protein
MTKWQPIETAPHDNSKVVIGGAWVCTTSLRDMDKGVPLTYDWLIDGFRWFDVMAHHPPLRGDFYHHSGDCYACHWSPSHWIKDGWLYRLVGPPKPPPFERKTTEAHPPYCSLCQREHHLYQPHDFMKKETK